MTTNTTETQRVDVQRIRYFFDDSNWDCVTPAAFFKEAKALAPMVKELLDLVEGSTLLQDASRARQEAAWMDETPVRRSTVHDALQTLVTDDRDPEDILPSMY